MIFPALLESADRGELLLVQDGLCRWHRRRDGSVTIRELIVLPFRRGTGVGRRLLVLVRQHNPGAILRARCPAHYPANGFWQRLGFRLAGTEKGVNLWECPP